MASVFLLCNAISKSPYLTLSDVQKVKTHAKMERYENKSERQASGKDGVNASFFKYINMCVGSKRYVKF